MHVCDGAWIDVYWISFLNEYDCIVCVCVCVLCFVCVCVCVCVCMRVGGAG